MKKTIVYTLIGLLLVLAVSCVSTTRVDELEFGLSEKEVVLQQDLTEKAAKIEELVANLEAATARIEELESTSIPSVNDAINSLEEVVDAVIPVGEKRIANLEAVVPVGEQRIETLESYLPLYYGVIGFFKEVVPLQQQCVDAMSNMIEANQALIDKFAEAGFPTEY